MTFDAKWCVNKRVVFIQYQDPVTLEDFQGVAKAMLDFIEEGEPPLVHNIIDYTYVTTMPTNVSQGSKALSHLGNPKYGWAIVVHAGNPIVKMRTAIMAKMNQNRFRAFDTVPEAIDFLKSIDLTLTESTWGNIVE